MVAMCLPSGNYMTSHHVHTLAPFVRNSLDSLIGSYLEFLKLNGANSLRSCTMWSRNLGNTLHKGEIATVLFDLNFCKDVNEGMMFFDNINILSEDVALRFKLATIY